MAVDKLVDSTQLDADLTTVANAIRTKGGTSADLAFPAGFVSAVEAIPSGGGGYTEEDVAKILDGSLTSISNTAVTSLRASLFRGDTSILSVSFPNVTTVNTDCFYGASNLASIDMPNIEALTSSSFRGTKISVFVMPKLRTMSGNSVFYQCTHLTTFDAGASLGSIVNSTFGNCTALTTVILRRSSGVTTIGNINVFSGTPFASGGTGGTLYVPSSLISSYQSATNWSTILGYANNQIKSIESTHTDPNAPIDLTLYYADGTPIT